MNMKDVIPIDRYDPAIEGGRIVYYAVKGKARYRMPDCYKEMYDDKHLAIKERTLERPEVFGVEARHYIPLRTA